MGFTNAVDLATKSLSEEDAEQLRAHDSYNPDARKLASVMAQGLKDQTDLQEEKRKFNEWAKSAGADESDIEDNAKAGEGGGSAEA